MPRRSGQITSHFWWEEAECRCGCIMPQAVVDQVVLTARWAETIRETLGNRPMKVQSWYRCPSWNRVVGGVPNSQHILGKAIDFTLREVGPRLVQVACRGLYPVHICGLGRYQGFTHVDRRAGPCATWAQETRALKA